MIVLYGFPVYAEEMKYITKVGYIFCHFVLLGFLFVCFFCILSYFLSRQYEEFLKHWSIKWVLNCWNTSEILGRNSWIGFVTSRMRQLSTVSPRHRLMMPFGSFGVYWQLRESSRWGVAIKLWGVRKFFFAKFVVEQLLSVLTLRVQILTGMCRTDPHKRGSAVIVDDSLWTLNQSCDLYRLNLLKVRFLRGPAKGAYTRILIVGS